MSKWYEKLFDNYGLQYDNESFVKGAIGECDFIESEISFNKKCRILDIGCGTGRHSIELASRGYNVTAVDLSESMLKRAKEKASAKNLTIDFQKQDARNLLFSKEFDLAIMLCEGAFPLMETDEMNYQIIQNAAKSLKSNGKLILTTLNGLFPLFHQVKDFLAQNKEKNDTNSTINRFDLMTFREHSITTLSDDSGNKMELKCDERYYVPSEITWLLKSVNFKKVEIYGAKLGAFSRNDCLTTDDFEMLVIACK